jgi:hypothetical protein
MDINNTASKIDWPSTQSILADLKHGPDCTAYGKRRTGKTTALCIRAAEFRIEGLTVAIVCGDEIKALVAEGILLEVVHELFPRSSGYMLEGIKVVHSVSDIQAERLLLDEPMLISDFVRRSLPSIHGQVISTN